MPFIRLSDDYNDHPKFDRLCDGAFRLWHQGMGFCRKYQTDGLIPIATVRKFKAYSSNRMTQLLTPWQDDKNPLWVQIPSFGIKVHDYLEWNLSKKEEEAEKDSAKLRMRRLRGGRSGVRSVEQEGERSAFVPGREGSDLDSEDPEKKTGRDPAAHFCDRFCELYREHRKGAHYHLKPSLDWTRVCDLLKTWEFARLEKLAVILLTTDEHWISTTDRGIGVFVSRASWCDDRLREWEAANGIQVMP